MPPDPGERSFTIRATNPAVTCLVDLLGVSSYYEKAGARGPLSGDPEGFIFAMFEAVETALKHFSSDRYAIYAFTDSIYVTDLGRPPDLKKLLAGISSIQAAVLAYRPGFASRAFCASGTFYLVDPKELFESRRGLALNAWQLATPLGTSVVKCVKLEQAFHGRGMPMGLFMEKHLASGNGLPTLPLFTHPDAVMINQLAPELAGDTIGLLLSRYVENQLRKSSYTNPLKEFLRLHAVESEQ